MAFTIIRHNVLNDQAATQQTQVTGNSLEIGRGSGNALLLEDLHISLRHAVIEYVDGRYVIKDVDSRGGTYVNHRAVRMQPLADGDVVHIGNFNLRMGVPANAGPLTIDVTREGTEEVAEDTAPVSYLSHYRLAESLFTKKRLTWSYRVLGLIPCLGSTPTPGASCGARSSTSTAFPRRCAPALLGSSRFGFNPRDSR